MLSSKVCEGRRLEDILSRSKSALSQPAQVQKAKSKISKALVFSFRQWKMNIKLKKEGKLGKWFGIQ
jgi:hypothetical protein